MDGAVGHAHAAGQLHTLVVSCIHSRVSVFVPFLRARWFGAVSLAAGTDGNWFCDPLQLVLRTEFTQQKYALAKQDNQPTQTNCRVFREELGQALMSCANSFNL